MKCNRGEFEKLSKHKKMLCSNYMSIFQNSTFYNLIFFFILFKLINIKLHLDFYTIFINNNLCTCKYKAEKITHFVFQKQLDKTSAKISTNSF